MIDLAKDAMQITSDSINIVASATAAVATADLDLDALGLVLDIVSFVAGAGAFVTPAAAQLCGSALDSVVSGLVRRSDSRAGANVGRVFDILGQLGASLQKGFSAPGEDGVTIITPSIQVRRRRAAEYSASCVPPIQLSCRSAVRK